MINEALWGSHIPAMMAAVGASSGPVLEVGVGHFSTPWLHVYCGATNRKLVSMEENREWHDIFCNRFTNSNHVFVHGCYAHTFPPWVKQGWSVVFIDHSPGGKSRADVFAAAIHHSSYVVVHDYHLDNEEHIAPLLNGLFQLHVTRTYQPPTLVASKSFRLPDSILCL